MENKQEENKSDDKQNNNNKKVVVAVIIILLILVVFFFVRGCFWNNQIAGDRDFSSQENQAENSYNKTGDEREDSELTPEEVLKALEQDDSLGNSADLEIISPEEKIFMPQQARLWRAEFSGIESDDSFRVDCEWDFYLDQNNKEKLYKEMDKVSRVSKENPQVCGFTSTFIESAGKLRVVLKTKVKNNEEEILGEYSAEREYQVQ